MACMEHRCTAAGCNWYAMDNTDGPNDCPLCGEPVIHYFDEESEHRRPHKTYRFAPMLILCALIVSPGCRQLNKLTGGSIHREATETPTFLLAGQSNMVRMTQYGLDAFTAEYVARHGGPDPVFVPCAVGGTYSPQWLPDGDLFNGCINAARGKKVTGILYYQGESDAYWSTPNWGENFGSTMAGFRHHFGNVPVVFAQIAISTDPDFLRGWQSIQDQQTAVSIPGVSMIQTKDVAQLVDTVHLTPSSLQIIAQRFADKI